MMVVFPESLNVPSPVTVEKGICEVKELLELASSKTAPAATVVVRPTWK
jgi:hypothetical protein